MQTDDELPMLESAVSLGYIKADSLPTNQVHVRHADFDAYLQNLPNRRRRKIKKSLKKFSGGGPVF